MLDKEIEWSIGFAVELLSPRLSVVITSISLAGEVNAAPFSCFMPVSYRPPRLCFSVVNAKHHLRDASFHYPKGESPREMLQLKQYAAETEETPKDTLANIMEGGEFGVNVLPVENLHQVIITSYRYPRGVNEIEVSGLSEYRSTLIKPPLIKEAKVGVECKMIAHLDFGSGSEKTTLIVGEALAWHVDSDIMEANEVKSERMHSLLQFARTAFGVCTDLRHHERSAYPPGVIPMPKPAK